MSDTTGKRQFTPPPRFRNTNASPRVVAVLAWDANRGAYVNSGGMQKVAGQSGNVPGEVVIGHEYAQCGLQHEPWTDEEVRDNLANGTFTVKPDEFVPDKWNPQKPAPAPSSGGGQSAPQPPAPPSPPPSADSSSEVPQHGGKTAEQWREWAVDVGAEEVAKGKLDSIKALADFIGVQVAGRTKIDLATQLVQGAMQQLDQGSMRSS